MATLYFDLKTAKIIIAKFIYFDEIKINVKTNQYISNFNISAEKLSDIFGFQKSLKIFKGINIHSLTIYFKINSLQPLKKVKVIDVQSNLNLRAIF